MRRNVAPDKKITLGTSTVAWWEADVYEWIDSRLGAGDIVGPRRKRASKPKAASKTKTHAATRDAASSPARMPTTPSTASRRPRRLGSPTDEA